MLLTEAEVLQAVNAVAAGQSQSFSLASVCFDKQLEFIEHPSRLKSLFCTRRAAKSYTGGLYLVSEALKNPNVNCLYIGLTRMSAKGILWKDVLKDIDIRNDLQMVPNETELTMTTQNGSIIWLTGADTHETEMEKLLGKKNKIVVIDEAASFSVDLRRMIYGILKPGTIDQGGTICLLGTSGNLTQGLFFDITQGKEPGWKLFEWSAHDNPYVAKQWQEELDDIRINRPAFMETPLYKQWYLNQWVIDEDKLVYRFDQERNVYGTLPTHRVGEWQYVLGVDLGYDPDPSAFVVAAFHENDTTLYFLECFKQTEMDVTDVATRIKEYQKRYNIFRVVIDGANKQAVEEIQRRHGISLTYADKTGKADFIQIMNAEFIQSKIKLNKSCEPLVDEYIKLIWTMEGDKIKLPRKEHPSCANHITDAALYAWRFCYQFLSEAAKPKINLRDRSAYLKHTEVLMQERLEKEIQEQQADEREEDIFNLSQMDSDASTMSYYLQKKRNA
jgi:hypothetical protein